MSGHQFDAAACLGGLLPELTAVTLPAMELTLRP
jgi:hypothetical protein